MDTLRKIWFLDFGGSGGGDSLGAILMEDTGYILMEDNSEILIE